MRISACLRRDPASCFRSSSGSICTCQDEGLLLFEYEDCLQGSARSSPSKGTQQLSLHAFTQIRSPSADPIATVTPIPATARFSSSTPVGDEGLHAQAFLSSSFVMLAAMMLCNDAETWVDKHAPKQEQHLIVHKKKAAEVHAWMEAAKAGHGPLSAVVTGAYAGC